MKGSLLNMMNSKVAVRVIAVVLAVLMLGGTVTVLVSVFGNL